ncbi:interferon-inducible GTPase 5-like [Paramuricea clavata]|uniref:Interferon-inducible GTPase 5-like n=1 Tax=Paramuricea clavata TaxID=317549 RepID=A0A6S7H500_PARCT|nr:interferon-inducible GTPase 5-like [Paramuricea clavata]
MQANLKTCRGLKENDRNAARKGECVETTSKESTSYSHPGNPNIKFSILPSIDQATFPAFQSSLDYAEIEKFDAFLIFTAGKFTKRHLEFSKIIKSSNKPLFFIRTKIDNDNHPEKRKEREIKVRLAKNLKELHCREYEIYLISNNHPNKWDFYKLAKAIADSLPSPQKEFFNKIPKIQELLAFKKFQNFLKETEAPEKLFHVDEIKRVFLESGIVGLVGLQRMMCQMKEVKINLAVLGNSGVGKSTFINAVRG